MIACLLTWSCDNGCPGHIRVPYLVMSSQKQWNRRTCRLSSKSQAANIMPDGNGNSILIFKGKHLLVISLIVVKSKADVAFLPCNQLMVEVKTKQQVVETADVEVLFQSVSSLPVIFQVLFQLLVLPIATTSQMMVLTSWEKNRWWLEKNLVCRTSKGWSNGTSPVSHILFLIQ